MMLLVQDILSYGFIFIGALFMLIAGIGIIRLPDFYIRMSAITKAGTIGIGFIALGISIHFNDIPIAGKSFVIVSFILLTSPVAAHIISRAAFHQKVPFWKKNLFDQLTDRINRLKELEKTASSNPEDIELKWNLIELYTSIPSLMGGSARKAIITASDIKDLNKTEGHLALGSIYMKEREFNIAEEEFLQAVEESNNAPRCLVELGKFYRFTGDNQKALNCFEQVLVKIHDDTNALLEFGKTSVYSGMELNKGKEYLKEILSNPAQTSHELLADAAFYLGEIFRIQKEINTAKEYYKMALDYFPNHPPAQNAMKNL